MPDSYNVRFQFKVWLCSASVGPTPKFFFCFIILFLAFVNIKMQAVELSVMRKSS